MSGTQVDLVLGKQHEACAHLACPMRGDAGCRSVRCTMLGGLQHRCARRAAQGPMSCCARIATQSPRPPMSSVFASACRSIPTYYLLESRLLAFLLPAFLLLASACRSIPTYYLLASQLLALLQPAFLLLASACRSIPTYYLLSYCLLGLFPHRTLVIKVLLHNVQQLNAGCAHR